MLAYMLRRLGYGLLTILAVSMLSFAIIQLPPGDYATAYISALEAQGDQVNQSEADALRAYFGLDDPMYMKYGRWMLGMLQGDYGISFEYRLPVREVIGDRLLLTVLLALVTILFTWVVAIPIGIFSAVRQYSVWDHSVTTVGFVGLAIPDFLLALVLLYFSWAWLGASVGGLFSPDYISAPWSVARVIDMLQHMIIPVIVLGTSGTAALTRIMRANLLDELRKPNVVTARAKGVSEWRLILKYPVRMALNPVISLTAYILPALVSGSIIVSVVLSLPTLGPLLLQSLTSQDMYLAGSIILMIGVMTVIGTFLSDLLLAWIDPRVRFDTKS